MKVLTFLILPVLMQTPSLDEILKQMEERDQNRNPALSYVCQRTYALVNKRFHSSAELQVRMTFRYPGIKKFEVLSEKGSSFIRTHVLKKMLEAEEEASSEDMRERARITPKNYTFQFLGTEEQQGRPCYVLSATPKVVNKFLMRGKIWVDTEDFVIVHIEGSPAQNPSRFIHNTKIVQHYTKQGAFWVPLYNRSSSDSFWFGHSDVTIDSSAYEFATASGPGL